jgi:hypothetical protein
LVSSSVENRFRIFAALAALGHVLACAEDPTKTEKNPELTGTLAVRPASEGWLEWVATDPEALKWLESKPGWTAFYKRRYRQSIESFRVGGRDPTADPERIGLARAHVELARFNSTLVRLLASSQINYFDARAKLEDTVPKLRLGAFYRGVASAFVRPNQTAVLFDELRAQPDASKSHVRLLGALAKSCTELSAKPTDTWTVVAAFLKCGLEDMSPPTCPKGQVAPTADLDDAWKERVAIYYSVVCGELGSFDDAALVELAKTAPESEMTSKATVGAVELQGTLAHHDVVALWALARFHLRRAETLFSGARAPEPALLAWTRSMIGDKSKVVPPSTEPVAAEFLVFSPWSDAAELQRSLSHKEEDPGSADVLLGQAEEMTNQLVARLDRSPQASARKVVKQLGLESSYADAFVRKKAALALAKNDCALALRLLRSTQDLKTGQEISYRNEPQFFADLAGGSLCMRRTPDAIAALRALRSSNPEVEGVLATVNSLGNLESVSKGTGGGIYEE